MQINHYDELNVIDIGNILIEGNVTPMQRYKNFRLSNGKPDTIAITLLSDIIYWFRPTIIRDEISGREIGIKKKFKYDLLQRGYKEYEDLYGFSTKQIREALVRLENVGVLKRVFRTINSNGNILSNVMFIQIFPSKIGEITKSNPISKEGNTYTYNTTDITTNISFSKKTKIKENLNDMEKNRIV